MACARSGAALKVIPVLDDAWHHAAFSFNGGTASLYVDGYLEDQVGYFLTVESIPKLERQLARDICGAMMFEGDSALKKIGVLSGGEKSRVMLGQLLVTPVNLLMLDEPTNHLDMGAIEWLEDVLLKWSGTLVLITHDRMMIRRLATRIIELDRGRIADFPGDYDNYLRRRAEMDNAEAQEQA